MNEIIAEREVFTITAKGEKKKFHIVLGRPYQVDDVSWACPVQIDGLYKNMHDVLGVDSWQSLGLAMSLVRQLLGLYLEDGGKLFGEEGGDEISIKDLFP